MSRSQSSCSCIASSFSREGRAKALGSRLVLADRARVDDSVFAVAATRESATLPFHELPFYDRGDAAAERGSGSNMPILPSRCGHGSLISRYEPFQGFLWSPALMPRFVRQGKERVRSMMYYTCTLGAGLDFWWIYFLGDASGRLFLEMVEWRLMSCSVCGVCVCLWGFSSW